MKSICVIGAGEAGINFIKEIRNLNRDIPLKLVDTRDKYFKRRNIFNYWSSLSKLEVLPLVDFCAEYSVEFVQAKVERINPNTKRVFLKDKPSLGFDNLVIASGFKSKNLSIKGDFREGFWYLSDIEPVKVKDYLSISSDIVVYVSTLLGIKLVLSLSLLKKDVKLMADSLDFLGDYQESFRGLLKERNIDVYTGVRIEEAIGESIVKAVKISLPKVFSSQLVFIDSGFKANRDFFEEEIIPRDVFFSPFPDIYLLGGAGSLHVENECFFIDMDEEVRREAVFLAKMLINREQLPYFPQEAPLSKKEEYLAGLLQQVKLPH